MSHSIWLVPPEPVFGQLKKTIKLLAAEYKGPEFEPHLTLLGPIECGLDEVESTCRQLAVDINQLKLSLGPVSFSTTHHQNVFVRVESSAALLNLNLKAKQILNMENDVYMPHISLLYGDHRMSLRERAAAEISVATSKFVVNKFVITPADTGPEGWMHKSEIMFQN